MSAFLGVPLAVGDRLVAMVGLANQPGGYSEADVEFLQPLLGAVRQLVLAWRGHAERRRARLQFQATSALLAEKSAALQVTFDSMSQGLTQVDAGGRVRFYNRRFLELLDLPEALLAGQPEHRDVVAFQRDRGDFGEDFNLIDPSLRAYIGQEPAVLPPEKYLRRTRDGPRAGDLHPVAGRGRHGADLHRRHVLRPGRGSLARRTPAPAVGAGGHAPGHLGDQCRDRGHGESTIAGPRCWATP